MELEEKDEGMAERQEEEGLISISSLAPATQKHTKSVVTHHGQTLPACQQRAPSHLSGRKHTHGIGLGLEAGGGESNWKILQGHIV